MPQNATEKKDRTEYFRLWHLRNRERRRIAQRANYLAHKERHKGYNEKARREHPERSAKYSADYRERHYPKTLETQKNWRARNREQERIRGREKGRKAYAEDREKILDRNRAWAARNKDKIRLRDLRRKALKAAAKEQQIMVNRNDLAGVNLLSQARRQWDQAFMKPGDLFSVSLDSGPKRKRKEWSHIITKHANRVLKKSRRYMEQSRATGANTILHGIG
jgi:hypothetical protein